MITTTQDPLTKDIGFILVMVPVVLLAAVPWVPRAAWATSGYWVGLLYEEETE